MPAKIGVLLLVLLLGVQLVSTFHVECNRLILKPLIYDFTEDTEEICTVSYELTGSKNFNIYFVKAELYHNLTRGGNWSVNNYFGRENVTYAYLEPTMTQIPGQFLLVIRADEYPVTINGWIDIDQPVK